MADGNDSSSAHPSGRTPAHGMKADVFGDDDAVTGSPPSVDFQHEARRFDWTTELDAAVQYLKHHGYVVIAGAASPTEVDAMRQLVWRWLEDLPGLGIRRDDVTTWERWPETIARTGIFRGAGIGQCAAMWAARTLQPVRATFERLWNTRELFVSFDGVCAYRPVLGHPEWGTLGGWYHVDQNAFNKPEFECVQGGITLYDCDEHTGGPVVLPGSHREFSTALREVSETQAIGPRSDFVLLLGHDILTRYRPTLLKARAGDLLLWDSRVVHCNSPALCPPRPVAPAQLQHCMLYVCMTPAAHVPPAERAAFAERRLQAYEARRTLNHLPHELNDLPELNPTLLPGEPLSRATLTRQQLALVCGTAPETTDGGP